MIDGIIKADGTSRLMRANLPATYEEFKAQAAAGTLPLDVLFNADGWSQVPTFLNKNNLLRDNTADLFGFNADAVPDDVFGVLSRFQNGLGNEYVWAKYTAETTAIYDTILAEYTHINTSGSSFYYAESFHIADGRFVLDNPQVMVWSYPSDLSFLTGKYCIPGGTATSGDTLYWLNNGAYMSEGMLTADPATVYSNIRDAASGTLVGYVNSPYSNAYPIDDGYTYTALGQLGNKVQSATGSYSGTGKYGSGNKNQLTFDFEPKFVYITQSDVYTGVTVLLITGLTGASVVGQTSKEYRLTVSWNGNSVTWYAASATTGAHQVNASGTTYRYVAIG